MSKGQINVRRLVGWIRSANSAFVRRLLFVVLFLLLTGSQGKSSPARSNWNNHSSLAEYAKALGHSGSLTASTEKGLDELVSRWCSAYRRSDPERVAALETERGRNRGPIRRLA